MNRLFVRVFGGLLLALMVVGLFCAFLYSSINMVRHEHHQVKVSSPAFDWLASQDSPLLNALLSDFSGSKVGHLSLDQTTNFPLSAVQLERLGYMQTLVVKQVHGYRVFRKLEGSNEVADIIVGYFPDLYTGANQLSGYLFAKDIEQQLLADISVDALQDSLPRLAQTFGIAAEKLNSSDVEMLSDDFQVESVQGYYFYPGDQNSPAVGYYEFTDGSIYRLYFPETFDTLSWPLLLTLLLLAVAGIGVAVYLLVFSIDKRLRSLETVATRIARGELDARMGVGRRDAIGRLGDAFNSMAEHIQRLVAVQREMIHAVSHELRTPVARIRFGVQMIEDCTSEAALHKQLTGIDSDIQELDELIDEILTYARLEQGGPILTFQDVDIKGIVEQVVSEQGGVKPDMTIKAVFDDGCEAWKQSDVEYRYIHRAIQNLVGNATRYASSTVKVHCSFDQDACRVDVEDDGAGIPESDWEKVFTPFARLDDSRTRSSGGYGLGLSIVRRILFWHGGQAFLGRSEMGGAKFSLVWPRRQTNE